MDEEKPRKPDPEDSKEEGKDRSEEKAVQPEEAAAAPGKKPKAAPAKPAPKAQEGEAAQPEAKAAAAKPAAKPPVRKPPQRGPAYEDLEEDPLLLALQAEFGADKVSGQTFLGQKIYTLAPDVLYDGLLFLRDRREWNFDYLVDLTALDYLPEDPRFCLVYHLYSYPAGLLIRVKSRVREGEYAPSVSSIWNVADWLEREVYDMFGLEFSGHPDLRRILLPEDWHGFPLRKDYDIKLQDQAWIRKHLRIRKVPN